MVTFEYLAEQQEVTLVFVNKLSKHLFLCSDTQESNGEGCLDVFFDAHLFSKYDISYTLVSDLDTKIRSWF